LFSRQDAKKLLDRVAIENPKVVEELTPKLLPLATVQRVLQNLLRERVSIRDGVSILEALSEAAASTRNPILLTEYVRQAIRRTVVKPYLNTTGDLPAYFMDPAIEQGIEGAVQHGEQISNHDAPQAIRDIPTHRAEDRNPGDAGGRGDKQRRAALPAADRRSLAR
jgi:flagellar biosynthesis protein FlhA